MQIASHRLNLEGAMLKMVTEREQQCSQTEAQWERQVKITTRAFAKQTLHYEYYHWIKCVKNNQQKVNIMSFKSLLFLCVRHYCVQS